MFNYVYILICISIKIKMQKNYGIYRFYIGSKYTLCVLHILVYTKVEKPTAATILVKKVKRFQTMWYNTSGVKI